MEQSGYGFVCLVGADSFVKSVLEIDLLWNGLAFPPELEDAVASVADLKLVRDRNWK